MKEFHIKRKGKEETLQIRMGDTPFLYYPRLTETNLVKHCFTTKLGGVSKGYYTSMNLSFTRGDKEEDVMENYRRITQVIGLELENIVCTEQTHTNHVKVVTQEDAGKGIVKAKDYKDVDGLVTNVSGLVLATFYADCVPLYFIDKKKKVIGLSHSGWRGTVNRIGAETIRIMKNTFGSCSEDILVAIGPSICKDCYEVSEDVYLEFAKGFAKEHLEEIFLDKKNGKYQLDLWKANEIILQEAGIKKENIVTTDICTCCNQEWLFSHRATGDKRGNLAAFLALAI
jgi:uncharacterized protein, YfiH family